MSGGPATFGRGGYPIAELSGMFQAAWPGVGGRLDAIANEQANADAYEPISEGVS